MWKVKHKLTLGRVVLTADGQGSVREGARLESEGTSCVLPFVRLPAERSTSSAIDPLLLVPTDSPPVFRPVPHSRCPARPVCLERVLVKLWSEGHQPDPDICHLGRRKDKVSWICLVWFPLFCFVSSVLAVSLSIGVLFANSVDTPTVSFDGLLGVERAGWSFWTRWRRWNCCSSTMASAGVGDPTERMVLLSVNGDWHEHMHQNAAS